MGRILSDWIDATPWMPRLHSRAEDAGFCQRLLATTEVWVCETEGAVAGFLSRDGAEIPALYLQAVARRKGWGAKLLDAAKRASNGHLALWTFQANDPARRFYDRQGFVETDRTDGEATEEKLPDLRLEWRAA